MILFADFDSTLFFMYDEAMTRTNLDAIKRWRDAGHQFCITTGRSYASVTRQMPEIKELCDAYILDGGSIILSASGKLLNAFFFDPQVVAGVTQFSKTLSEVPIPFYYTPNSEGITYQTENITKLRLWFKDLELLPGVAEQIGNSFPVFAFVQDAVSNYKELTGQKGFVEVIPIGYGKSHAIKVFAKERGIPVQDIITIGDGLNDHDMISDFNGFAIAGSHLSKIYGELRTTASVAALVQQLLQGTASKDGLSNN